MAGNQEIAVVHGSGREMPSRMPSPFEEMDRFFENFLPRALSAWPSFAETPMPRVDVIDKDDEILVRAEVAGVDKNDLDISLTENTLNIREPLIYSRTAATRLCGMRLTKRGEAEWSFHSQVERQRESPVTNGNAPPKPRPSGFRENRALAAWRSLAS